MMSVLPEIIRGVSVCDQEDGDSGVILDGVDGVGAVRVVFTSMSTERFEERFTITVSSMFLIVKFENLLHQIRIS